MAAFLIGVFTVILLIICGLMTVIILMQRSSANAGMGSALGGGAAETVFGGETSNVLLKNTIYVAVAYFVLSFALYLGVLAHTGTSGPILQNAGAKNAVPALPSAAAVTPAANTTATPPASTAPATMTPAPAADLKTPIASTTTVAPAANSTSTAPTPAPMPASAKPAPATAPKP